MLVAAVLNRAQSAIGQGIRYKLGKGGMDPGSPTPASASDQCECSGFVAWCLGMSRQTTQLFYVNFNGGWLDTTAIWTDIGSSAGIFEPSEKRPGAVVVYPSPTRGHGHIGIVLDANHVIHCSSGNDKKFRDSIQSTAFTVFNKNPKSRFGWLTGLQ
jgi:hypothetical protein